MNEFPMNNPEAHQAHLSEITAMRDFLKARESGILKQVSEFKSVADLFLARKGATKSNKRLVSFFRDCGFVVLDALGEADNSANKRKKDWRDSISETIAKNPETLLPVMQSLYNSIAKRIPEVCVDAVGEFESRNRVKNLLTELKKAKFLVSFSDNDQGFSAQLVGDFLVSKKLQSEMTREKENWIRFQWAEKAFLYLAQKTFREFSRERKLPVDFYWNVRVSDKPPYSMASTEFDILVWIDDKWYVFESKAGSTLSVVRWVDRWHLFGEDKPDRKATIIQCSIGDFQPQVFSPLLIFPLCTFEKSLKELLSRDFPVRKVPNHHDESRSSTIE